MTRKGRIRQPRNSAYNDARSKGIRPLRRRVVSSQGLAKRVEDIQALGLSMGAKIPAERVKGHIEDLRLSREKKWKWYRRANLQQKSELQNKALAAFIAKHGRRPSPRVWAKFYDQFLAYQRSSTKLDLERRPRELKQYSQARGALAELYQVLFQSDIPYFPPQVLSSRPRKLASIEEWHRKWGVFLQKGGKDRLKELVRGLTDAPGVHHHRLRDEIDKLE